MMLLLSACGAVVTPHYDPYGNRVLVITCATNKALCQNKAQEICQGGYNLVEAKQPIGTGLYYANHYSGLATEDDAYSMTVSCK